MAEAGLNVENEFAELDAPTATRLSREAASQQQNQNQARKVGGRNAIDMLTSDVEP